MIAARRHLIGHALLWVIAFLNVASGLAMVTSEGWAGPTELQWTVLIVGTALSLVVALLSQIHHHRLAMGCAWALALLYLVSRYVSAEGVPFVWTVFLQQLTFAALTVGGTLLASRSTSTKSAHHG